MTFSKPLIPGALDPGNWTARHASFDWSCNTAVATGSIVTCDMAQGGEASAEEQCSYDPPPFDVVGTRGYPAVAFTNFPIA